jgi:16S rRNA (guanine1207-N2)-methyltransferase
VSEAVYGAPPLDLATPAADAVQVSPLVPGAAAIESLPNASQSRMVVLAPPGTLERRYVLAHALRALEPDGELVAMAPKIRGGARLGAELAAFGCEVGESARRHHRICRCLPPAAPAGVEAAIAAGEPRIVPGLGLWSQPGVFSWDRLDAGTARLAAALPPLSGRGADLGCGIGVLGRSVLESPAVEALAMIDIDRRAVDAARRNVADARARFVHADARATPLEGLDFVVMNPPFHEQGREATALGVAFIQAAARALRKGGACWMVANATLPYEAPLESAFRRTALVSRAGGYKVYEARL